MFSVLVSVKLLCGMSMNEVFVSVYWLRFHLLYGLGEKIGLMRFSVFE